MNKVVSRLGLGRWPAALALAAVACGSPPQSGFGGESTTKVHAGRNAWTEWAMFTLAVALPSIVRWRTPISGARATVAECRRAREPLCTAFCAEAHAR
jgi:hypothetical protein